MVNLEFPLEQHTPLLHFQHLQQGATLRASAVKPMLDRWLVGKVWNDDFNACKTCLVGYKPTELEKLEEKFRNGYRALNYKMRIEPKGALVSEYIASMDLFGDDAVDPADYYMSGDARTRNLIVGIYRQLRENYRP